MSKGAHHKFTRNNYQKYFVLLLLLMISLSLYQCIENGTTEKIPTQSTKEKAAPKKTNSTNPKKDRQYPSSEKTIQSNANAGTFTDMRDGQAYQWTRLKDGKKWMTKNLNYEIDGTWCYDETSINCNKYGRLYTWQAANNACPKGWRLPSDKEWWTMASHYGKAYNSYAGQEKMEGKDDGEVAYKALMEGGETGFTALLGGSHSSAEGFDYLGALGCYWTSTDSNASNAMGYYFYIHSRGLARDSYHKGLGYSCRCLQD
ncbi:MAG: FISUMP domain-containing protein [Saprospiraceae bacterium]